jgi:hypothetical protein
MLFFVIGIRVLIFHVKKKHEEGYGLIHHLRTKMKYMVL